MIFFICPEKSDNTYKYNLQENFENLIKRRYRHPTDIDTTTPITKNSYNANALKSMQNVLDYFVNKFSKNCVILSNHEDYLGGKFLIYDVFILAHEYFDEKLSKNINISSMKIQVIFHDRENPNINFCDYEHIFNNFDTSLSQVGFKGNKLVYTTAFRDGIEYGYVTIFFLQIKYNRLAYIIKNDYTIFSVNNELRVAHSDLGIVYISKQNISAFIDELQDCEYNYDRISRDISDITNYLIQKYQYNKGQKYSCYDYFIEGKKFIYVHEIYGLDEKKPKAINKQDIPKPCPKNSTQRHSNYNSESESESDSETKKHETFMKKNVAKCVPKTKAKCVPKTELVLGKKL